MLFIRFHTLFICFHTHSDDSTMLLYAFHTLSYAFHTLSYAFHKLSYAFHMLFIRFYMLSYAYIRFHTLIMHIQGIDALLWCFASCWCINCHQMLTASLMLTGFYLRKPVIKILMQKYKNTREEVSVNTRYFYNNFIFWRKSMQHLGPPLLSL